MKILSVVGARPNFVKIAPVLAELRKLPGIQMFLVHTGQHYDPEMSAWFFRDLRIPPPDVNLRELPGRNNGRMEPPARDPAGLSIAEMARQMEPILIRERPDVVLVVGDVNSTLAGALAAARLGLPVVHLEAGLRSFDLSMPEEINRIATDTVSGLLLASEPSGVQNLRNEGKRDDQIFLVGNVMIDTLRRFLPHARRSKILDTLRLRKNRRGAEVERYALVTLHRAATTDSPETLRALWEALCDIALEIPVIFPVHPRTGKRLREAGLEPRRAPYAQRGKSAIGLIHPLSYVDFLCLESNASMVITDSGGIQEETTALGVPCLTARDSTERPITVTEGTNTLVGLDPHALREQTHQVLLGKGKRGKVPDLWDGYAAPRIVKILTRQFRAEKWKGAA
ncbi:MAG: non-hydrolyzing UDP-N-acetylglucosamine 2-epimerase [Terriglobia bacterium]